jgi:hypothetical protein
MDTLEHINHSAYYNVISEMIRVTRKTIIIGFPSGKGAEEAEQRLRILVEEKIKNWKGNEEAKVRFLERNVFLFQHIEKGMPSVEEIMNILHMD